MITHIVNFFIMLGVGTGFWFFFITILRHIINWHIVNYPQWSSMAQVGFIIAVSEWGLLLLCVLPAVVYLISNTQRPEVVG